MPQIMNHLGQVVPVNFLFNEGDLIIHTDPNVDCGPYLVEAFGIEGRNIWRLHNIRSGGHAYQGSDQPTCREFLRSWSMRDDWSWVLVPSTRWGIRLPIGMPNLGAYQHG